MSISCFNTWSIHTFCILLCFIISTSVFAQTDTANSQLEIKAFEESLKGKSFYSINKIFFKEKNRDSIKASIVSKYLRDHFLNDKSKKVSAETSITLSYWEDKVGNPEEAFSLLNKAIKISKEIKNDSILYLAYLRKGSYYYKIGKNGEALEPYYKALGIAKLNNDIKRKIAVTGNIALVKIQTNDYNSAISLLLKNLEIVDKNPGVVNDKKKILYYVSLCAAYTEIESYDKASFYCGEGMKINESVNNIRAKAHFLSAFAEIERSKGNYAKSYELLDKTEKLIDSVVGNESLLLFVKLYRGKTYYAEKKYSKVISELEILEKLKEQHGVDFFGLQEMYFYLAKSYTAIGNLETGVKYYEKVSELDAENDKKKTDLNENMTKKIDLVQLKEEISLLQIKSKRIKYYYIGGITLLLLVILGLIIYYKKQQRKNKERFNTLMLQLEEKRKQEKVRQAAPEKEKEHKSKPSGNTAIKTEKTIVKHVKIDAKTTEILKKLEEFETKELFLSQESTLVEVAKKIQTNTTYLSKVINTHKEKSFTAYITDLRVNYAIERLSTDRKFRSFTIGAIAQEIGFKRSESFSKAFKVKTGLYPSYFIKELEKQ